jgi:hypothetical protein
LIPNVCSITVSAGSGAGRNCSPFGCDLSPRGGTLTIDERSRHQLYLRLEELLGADEANTLMEHLPPVGWADVATKRDLEHLRFGITADLRLELNHQMLEFNQQIRSVYQVMVATMLGTATFAGALAFVAAQVA